MTTTTQLRKTTEAALNPEDWGPITAWLRRHDVLKGPARMLATGEALPGLAQMLRKAARNDPSQDMTIRLSNDQMEALREQIGFWSCFQDELKQEFRRDVPNWRYFHCLADQIGAALEETQRENKRRIQDPPSKGRSRARRVQPREASAAPQ